jgi:phosphoribosylformylglycinamidine synthase I
MRRQAFEDGGGFITWGFTNDDMHDRFTMAQTIGVLIFPGSNCDHDAIEAVQTHMGAQARAVWHKETSLGGIDALIVPGGFSYGDYLRAGAIARFSPIMTEVIRFAASGGPVIGICNGFQVLCEAGLLPGALVRNQSLSFACKQVRLRVESTSTPFTNAYAEGDVLTIPIAHGEGNYLAPASVLETMEAEGRVVFRYVGADGSPSDAANPNGSMNHIAGICNEARNVVGMMPHPERAMEAVLGSTDGLGVFSSLGRFLSDLPVAA